MTQARLARPAGEAGAQYDAIVIGSGYGGGVAASRLARIGLKVAVLERGRELLPGDFPTGLISAQRQTQIRIAGRRVGPATGLFDMRVGRDVHVLAGCGVGGTSLINANVCLNPDALVFEDERWPDPIRRDHYLNLGFHRARAMLAPVPLPETSNPLKLQALTKAAEAMGRSVERVPLHITFAEGVNRAGVRQPACTGCGDCMGGCNVGAKTTVHSTYLADAVVHGASIFEGAEVRYVEAAAEGGWRVVFQMTDERERIVPRRSVVAPTVVVAAGTLGTNEILLRSRERGLHLSSLLGKRITTNGDAIAIGYDNKLACNAIGIGIGIGTAPGASVPPPGPAVTGLIDLRRRRAPQDRLAIVEAAVQSSLSHVLPLLLPAAKALAPGGDAMKGLDDLLAGAKGTVESLFGGAYAGAASRTMFYLAVGHDSGSGEITLAGDDLQIVWPNALDEPVFKAIDETLGRIVGSTGGTYVPNPVASRFLGGNLFTVHPLGGCAMGSDRTTGVVDHKCRVFDGAPGRAADAIHAGLYVCDGAAMPRSLGIHPLLTITAIAERAMLLAARERGVALGVEPKPGIPERSFVASGGARKGRRVAGRPARS